MPALATAPASVAPAPPAQWPRPRTLAYLAGLLAAVTLGALLGWQGPRWWPHTGPDYVGRPAATLAADLGCAGYQPLPTGAATYPHHTRGTCTLDGTPLTVVTFDRDSDVTAFTTLMNGVVPLLHPARRNATIATGTGWVAFDTGAMGAAAAENALRAVGAGQTHVINPA